QGPQPAVPGHGNCHPSRGAEQARSPFWLRYLPPAGQDNSCHQSGRRPPRRSDAPSESAGELVEPVAQEGGLGGAEGEGGPVRGGEGGIEGEGPGAEAWVGGRGGA